MDKPVTPWVHHRNQDDWVEDEYKDFEQLLPSHNGIFGLVTITLMDQEGELPSAYGEISFSEDNGEEHVSPQGFDLSRTQAERILGCVENVGMMANVRPRKGQKEAL